MQKFLRSIVTAIVSGIVFLLGSIFILMEIGLSQHDNYDFYGDYPVLYLVSAVAGFVLPSFVAWLLRRSQGDEDLGPSRQ